MAMKRWRNLPTEPKGNKDRNEIYLSVGKAISEWEALQSTIAHLFCAVVMCDNQSLHRAFGTIMDVPPKAEMLIYAAKETFKDDPEFRNKITSHAEELKRANYFRNDIAHGVAITLSRPGFHTSYEYEDRVSGTYLIPGYSQSKKKFNKTREFAYCWTSQQVDYYTEGFHELRRNTINLTNEVKSRQPGPD